MNTKSTFSEIINSLNEWNDKKAELGSQFRTMKRGEFPKEDVVPKESRLKELFFRAINAKFFELSTQSQPSDERVRPEALEELLHFALNGIRICTGVDRIRLYLYDNIHKILELTMDDGHVNEAGDPIRLSSPSTRGKFDLKVTAEETAHSFIVRTFRNREPVLLAVDAVEREDPILRERLDILGIDGPIAIVPIGYHINEPIGVIGVDNRADNPAPITHEDVVSIMTLGNQVIAAVASTGRLHQAEELYRSQAKELDIHNDVARLIIGDPDSIDALYQEMLDKALPVLEIHFGVIYREQNGTIGMVRRSDGSNDILPLPEEVREHFADDDRLGNPMFSDEIGIVSSFRQLSVAFPEARSFGVYCLYTRGISKGSPLVRLGYLVAASRHPAHFTTAVKSRLIGFIRLLAHAISYHLLNQEYKRSEHHKKLLIRNLEHLNAMNPDTFQRNAYRGVLKRLTAFLAEEIGADYGFVCDWDGHALEVIDAYPEDLFTRTEPHRITRAKPRYQRGDNSLVAIVLDQPDPFPFVIQNDTRQAERDGLYLYRSIDDSCSELVVRIQEGPGGSPLCVFNFQSRRKGFFHRSHAEEVLQLSPVAVTAIKMTRLFDRYHSAVLHSSYFSKLAESIGDSIKTGALLQELVVVVGRALATCKYGYVLVRDVLSMDETFEVKYSLPSDERPVSAQTRFRPGQGHVGEAVSLRKTVVCPDTEKSDQYLPGWEGVRSEVAIPVFDRSSSSMAPPVIAVLLYAHTDPNHFQEGTAMIHQLEELAEQLGSTIPKIQGARWSTAIFISYPSTHNAYAEDLYH
ncbi:GAF domain-containing protein, partial [Endothiovibrio diazotrophicus]